MRTAAQAFRRLEGALALALSFLPSVLIASGPSVPVLVDFRVAADYPLSKTKFAVYNSGFVPLQHYKRDEPLFRELQPESLRIDLWWGGGKWSRPPVSGTSEQLRFDFEEMDGLAELLNRNGIRPYWAYCYIPAPLQPPGARDSRKFNNNFKMWGEAVAAFARHAREKGAGKTIGYHEIYNEPDNRDFFLGTMQDYFGMYREGSLAIRAADPDAIIGGPAVAFTDDWVSPFLDMVAGERLPLDFFSFHYYPGVPWKAKDLAGVVANIRGELAKHPALSTTEMHLNEFNSYRIDYPRGGRQDRFGIASAMLRDYKWFLSQPDLTRVHWAQFQDTAGGNWSGMISFDGHRKALFNAALIYARLPVDRVALQVNEVSGVEGLAAVENDRGGVVLWNNSGTNRAIELAIKGLPFSKGTFRVFRIDAEHSSWGDKPEQERLEPVETMKNVSLANFRWPGLLPASGVVYLEAEASNPPARTLRGKRPEVTRVLRHYPNRFSKSYSDFDPATCTARLGMGSEINGSEQIGFVTDSLPGKLHVRVQRNDNFARPETGGLLGVRIDYFTGENYSYACFYHGPSGGAPDLLNAGDTIVPPWGTRRAADRSVRVRNLSSFEIVPSRRAPPGWTGRVQVTFLMRNTGPGTMARFIMEGK